jgi:hypothetical protein
MRVVFECENPKLYDLLEAAFSNAKFVDEYDLAELETSDDSAVYKTCCKNIWFVERRGERVMFGYEGTRAGAVALMPFRYLDKCALYWSDLDHERPILAIVLEWQEVSKFEDGKEIVCERVPKVIKRFQLQLVEYVTSTPPSWELTWYDQVERVPTDKTKAVIMRGSWPVRVVDYADVYHPVSLE